MSGEAHLGRWEGESMPYWTRVWDLPELHFLPQTASTNDDAMRLAELGAPAGTTVLTEEQTAGKGRLGRRWLAPAGKALLLSVVIRPLPPRATLSIPGVVPIRVGLAVARAIEDVTQLAAGLKWPNDIVLAGAGKVAGILCESAFTDSAAAWVIAGMGINVNQRPDELPDEAHATSLAIVAGHEIPRAELAGAVLAEVARIAPVAAEPLEPEDLDEYRRLDVLFGTSILIDGSPAGTASGIEPDGSLKVAGPDGTRIIRGGTVRLAEVPTTHPFYPVGPPHTRGRPADEVP